MCVRGYSLDAINLDEKLETTSKLPHNIQFEKSFTGKLRLFLTNL